MADGARVPELELVLRTGRDELTAFAAPALRRLDAIGSDRLRISHLVADHTTDDRISELAGADGRRVVAVVLQVVSDVLAFGDDRGDGTVEPVGRLALAEMLEHERPREHQRHGVDLVLTGVLGRRAVDGLEDGNAFADVGAGRHAETA